MVSRQLRADTLPMFYATTSFEFHLSPRDLGPKQAGVDTEHVNAWLKAIGRSNMERVRKLSVRYYSRCLQNAGMTRDQMMSEEGLADIAGVANFVNLDW